MLKVGIMQPYLFPYIGYFQLINTVDEFIIYDNIQFTKKGWINRNRILVNGVDAYITLPLKKDSDYLDVKDRYLTDDWNTERNKMVNKIAESYRKAPQFSIVFPLIEMILMYSGKNLFDFILNSLKQINHFLDINTPLIISSSIDIDHELKAEKKVIAAMQTEMILFLIKKGLGFPEYWQGLSLQPESRRRQTSPYLPWAALWRYIGGQFAAMSRTCSHRLKAVTQCCAMPYGQPNMAHCKRSPSPFSADERILYRAGRLCR